MRVAMSSAVRTLDTATAVLDRGAARTAAAATAAAGVTVPAARPAVAPPPAPAPDLLDATVDLMIAPRLAQAGATTARQADEAYRAVLGLLEPPR